MQAGAIVRELANPVQHQVDNLLADGIMAACEIIGRIPFAGSELLGMEELTVRAGANLVDDGGFQIDHDAPRNVFACTHLR